MSLGVLVGGLMLMLGITNLVLKVGGEPAPSYAAIALFILSGGVLLGVPVGIAMRDVLRGRRA